METGLLRGSPRQRVVPGVDTKLAEAPVRLPGAMDCCWREGLHLITVWPSRGYSGATSSQSFAGGRRVETFPGHSACPPSFRCGACPMHSSTLVQYHFPC